MTLAGFRAQNHPQQTGARGALDEVDDRGTHPDYFDPWNAEYGPFTLDVAAAPHNAKCDRYFTRADNGLEQSWAGEKVWCNPPYSNLGDWLAKAWAEYPTTRGIVMLLPANRVEQKWWQEHVEPYRDRAGSPLSVKFLPGRMRFIRPDAVIGPKGDRPPFGCCLLIWEKPEPYTSERGIRASHDTAEDDFGDAGIQARMQELKAQGVDLSTIPNESRLRHDTRDAGACECGEPVEQVRGVDRVWRWAHTERGTVRDHVARPVG